MTGDTGSSDFPTTPGAFQRGFGGGPSDGFVTTLRRDGARLAHSTFIGGSGADGTHDGELDAAGTGAVYSTYLGGEVDIAGSVRVDRHGVAHVPGLTGSPDFPVTGGAFQVTYGGGPADAFLVLLSRDGSRLRFGSFLGGSDDDGSVGAGSWLDGRGNWFIPGFTNSADFPVTPGAYQTANAGGYDVFLVKVTLGKRHKGSGQRTASVTAQGGGSGARTGLTRDRMMTRRR